MQARLVMTVIGKDRTGLVESLARLVASHEGNWLESRMCRLGGEFAGILCMEVPAEKRTALERALAQLSGLTVVVHGDESARAAGELRFASLEVIGPDRPGIVREISAALASRGVNLEDLVTECSSAPMSGEPLFQAKAKLLLPAGVSVGELQQSLARAANELGVEFSVATL